MSDNDKNKIYKSYLQSIANFRNEELSLPTNDKVKYPKSLDNTLTDLVEFFRSHSHINIDMFMDAPYKVYSEEKIAGNYYPLDFYLKPIALNTYFMYLNLLDEETPDSKDNLLLIKDSIIFIKDFCISKNIPLKQYLSYSDSATYSWCNHLLNNNISIYNILAFSFFNINIYMLLNQLPNDEKELFLHQYNDNINEYMKRLNNSEKAKVLLLQGYKKIKKIIEGQLKN